MYGMVESCVLNMYKFCLVCIILLFFHLIGSTSWTLRIVIDAMLITHVWLLEPAAVDRLLTFRRILAAAMIVEVGLLQVSAHGEHAPVGF